MEAYKGRAGRDGRVHGYERGKNGRVQGYEGWEWAGTAVGRVGMEGYTRRRGMNGRVQGYEG